MALKASTRPISHQNVNWDVGRESLQTPQAFPTYLDRFLNLVGPHVSFSIVSVTFMADFIILSLLLRFSRTQGVDKDRAPEIRFPTFPCLMMMMAS